MRRWRVVLDAGMDPRWDVVRLPAQVMRQETIWKLRQKKDSKAKSILRELLRELLGSYAGSY